MKNISINKIGMVTALSLTLATAPFLANAAMLTRQLQIGMSGSDVSSLQTFLAQDSSVYPQGLVTGYFGGLTKSAVTRFQAKNGIATVGRVGPVTLSAINARMGTGMSPVAVIGAPSIGVSGSQATISWNTSIPTSASVYYSTSPISMTEATDSSAFSIAANGTLLHSDLRTSHSGTITGLSGNTTYYYVIYVRDAAGNENIMTPTSFVTSNF